jgi:hypothetical protein
MPPSFCGAGNAIAFAATPCVGWGRNLPIIPSASFVNVLILGTLQMLSSKGICPSSHGLQQSLSIT